MPMIDAKFTVAVDDTKKEELKSEFGKLIATLHKGEAYLMVGIQDGYDLWFGGKKLDKGAYVEVSLLGNAPSEDYNKLTGQICDMLADKLGIIDVIENETLTCYNGIPGKGCGKCPACLLRNRGYAEWRGRGGVLLSRRKFGIITHI